MRLLQRQSDGSFCLTRDLVDPIPSYAILSHTWGDDDQEVTFQDIKNGTGWYKEGYRKIEFCGRQAALDGLDHFWVDTCCIDKANSNELQEAINLMFRWYQNSAKCYVYLSDVSKTDSNLTGDVSDLTWKKALWRSRWFTRGWTLQELLAPSSVEFFSKECQRLGDKGSLTTFIHDITKVPCSALHGTPLSEFSETERMSWSDTRHTRKEEDMAYSLLGIFDVHMPMIYGEGKQNAFRRLREEIERKKSGLRGLPRFLHMQPQAGRNPHFLVPFGQNESFVGREAILAQLLEKIPPAAQKNDCQRTIIEGLGGIGKTQIALEAAYRVRERYPDCSVFWVPIVNIATFENAYREMGQALGVQGIDDDNTDIKALVKMTLSRESAGSWLLIIDNADDTGLLFDERDGASIHSALPFSRHGSILFTTRNHLVSTQLDIPPRSVIATEEMTRTESVEMLQGHLKKSQIDEASTEQLVDFLACLPLAIKQASAHMIRTGITTTRYLEYCLLPNNTAIKLLSLDFEDRNRYPGTANPIVTTWIISFNHIAEKWPLAAEYLKFICCLAEKDVPVSLLYGEDEIEKDKAIGVLKAYAFITERETPASFDIHRLVRIAMRNWLKERGEQRERVTRSTQRLVSAIPFPEHENTHVWMAYLPHAISVIELQEDCADLKARAGILFTVAECHSMIGKYGEAERLYRQALKLKQFVMGREHPDTLTAMNNLAFVLDLEGKYSEAEQMHREALGLREKVMGREHPDTLTSINNLAEVFRHQTNYDEAEKMYREALQLKGKVLGQTHASTLDSLTNLGIVLELRGKYSEAEEIHRGTLMIREKDPGQEHPSTLMSKNNLGIVLQRQGKHDVAEQIHRETLALRETVLGRLNLRTIDSVYNLAVVFESQRKHGEAEQMYREAGKRRETVLGREHPRTFGSVTSLANVLSAQGKYQEAEDLYRETLKIREKVLGQQHTETAENRRSVQATIEARRNTPVARVV